MRLTLNQRAALALIDRFDAEQASVATADATWHDSYGAFIHWRTAKALADRGLIAIDDNYPDGWVLLMTEAGREVVANARA